MNKLISRLLAFVAVTQVGTAGAVIAAQNSSLSPDADAWQQAVAVNSLEAYAKFSMDFPNSEYAHQARLKLTVLATDGSDIEIDATANELSKAFSPEFVPNFIMTV